MKFFPPLDARQRLRLRRTLLGFVSYFLFLVPLGYAEYFGWLDVGVGGLALLAGIGALINLVWMLLIVSGLNLRFRDPSLTFWQIAVSSVFAVVVIAYAGPAKGVLLLLFFLGMFFGVFRLTTRQFAVLTVLTGINYGVYMLITYAGRPLGREFELDLLRLITLETVLAWLSFLGGYVARLRQTLHLRNDELERALAAASESARRDSLTDTFNRRHIDRLLAGERERALRYGEVFSVVILDLDHFKAINDTHGHLVGDEVLRGFVQRVNRLVRSPDLLGERHAERSVGRYGGEEFLLVLPNTDLAGARICAERIRKGVERQPILTSRQDVPLTVSAGVAEYLPTESVKALVDRADRALYDAKQAGRNRVATA